MNRPPRAIARGGLRLRLLHFSSTPPPPLPPEHRGEEQANGSDRRGFGNGADSAQAIERRTREERRALDPDVEVDDAVIVDVDLPVVIEVSVVPAGDAQGGVEVDPPVVVDVDPAVEVGV